MNHPILELRDVSDELYEASDLDLRNLSESRLWLFDLEATGLDTTRERVTQIAGIPIEGGQMLESESFVQFVYPGEGVEIPKVVQDLTGITLDMLSDAPPLSEAWPLCMEAAGDADLWIGQSVFEFDVPLLEAEFARHSMPAELPPIVDSVVLATFLLGEPVKRWSTSALIDAFQVSTEGLRRHDALDDVKILGRILLPLLERIRNEHDDCVQITPSKPLAIRRHPPIRS